jgi:hypothetical protein
MSAESLPKRRSSRFQTWILGVGALIALGGVAALALSSMRLDSPTYDEPAHIVNGWLRLERGTCGFYREQPPLSDMLSAIPVVWAGAVFPDLPPGLDEWSTGRAFLFHPANDSDRLLFLARLPSLALLLVLCLIVGLWVLDVTRNRWLALLAMTLAGTCPNLLAHGRLATSDIAVTTFAVLTSYTFVRALESRRATVAALAGLFLALAVLSKVSGLVVMPYLLLLATGFAFHVRNLDGGGIGGPLALAARQLATTVVAFLLAMEAFYLLTLHPMSVSECYPQLAGTMVGRLAIPALEYGRHFTSILAWISGEGPGLAKQFLLGSYSTTGWWYYFPVAFALKTPIATQVLLLVFGGGTLVSAFLGRGKVLSLERSRVRFHVQACAAFVGLMFLATFTNRINIGLRYVLPIFPFIYVLVAIGVADAMAAGWARRTAALALVALLAAWHVGSSLATHPGYLGYFNEIVGGNRNADRFLIDSNLDWGQDLRRLGIWAADNGVSRVNLIYFGGGEPAHYLGERSAPLRAVPLPIRPGYYAVSRHLYRLSGYSKGRPGMVDLESYFSNAEYVTTIGTSILVFKR